ncbi:MAG: ABC transporter permease [Lentisphaerae bacterium]|nr:ABC transporter permease [Lentisphaerota bacterium]
MTACFLSPVAYVTLVAFLGVSGFTFWLACFRNEGNPEPVSVLLCGSLMFWLPIMITVVAMRLFVEEKRSGTIETLLTAPVTEGQIVLGKYLGAFTFLLLALVPALAYPFVLERLSPALTLENLDLGALLGASVVTVLVTGTFLAIAVVASLTTRNQIVAAICTFFMLWLALLGGWLLGESHGVPAVLADGLSITRHIDVFSRGTLEIRPIVFHVTLTGLLLFTAVRMLESRRWK